MIARAVLFEALRQANRVAILFSFPSLRRMSLRSLSALFCSLTLTLGAQAEPAAAVSDADRAAVKKTIAAATTGEPHEKIFAAAKSVPSAALRNKLIVFLPELERAAE